MDEILLKQLVRQVKILNFWVSFFGILFIATFVIAGFLLFKAVTYIQHADQSIQNAQTKVNQTLDVQKQLCDSSAASVLKQYTDTCK